MYGLAALRKGEVLVLGGFLWLAGTSSATAQDQSPLAKRLFREAPRAWEQQQNFWLTLEGTTRTDRRVRSDGKWTSSPFKSYWKQCNGSILDQFETLESGSWNGNVRGENSEYIFRLGRDSETRPWVIQQVKKKVEKSLDVWNDRKTLCEALILAPRTPNLAEIFQAQGFKCLNVAPEPTNSEELVRLTFTFTPEGMNRLRGGWVVLDPSHYWVIRSSEVDLDLGDQRKGTGRWTTHKDYKEGSDHHPIMTKSVLKGKIWENGRIISEAEYSADNDLQERPSIPESEFTLSAYGLPEPSWAQPKKTRWYLWAGLAGIVCLVSGGVFHWLKRRASGL